MEAGAPPPLLSDSESEYELIDRSVSPNIRGKEMLATKDRNNKNGRSATSRCDAEGKRVLVDESETSEMVRRMTEIVHERRLRESSNDKGQFSTAIRTLGIAFVLLAIVYDSFGFTAANSEQKVAEPSSLYLKEALLEKQKEWDKEREKLELEQILYREMVNLEKFMDERDREVEINDLADLLKKSEVKQRKDMERKQQEIEKKDSEIKELQDIVDMLNKAASKQHNEFVEEQEVTENAHVEEINSRDQEIIELKKANDKNKRTISSLDRKLRNGEEEFEGKDEEHFNLKDTKDVKQPKTDHLLFIGIILPADHHTFYIDKHFVVSVNEGGGGLRRGDSIVQVNGKDVFGLSDLDVIDLIRISFEFGEVPMLVRRDLVAFHEYLKRNKADKTSERVNAWK